MKVIEVYEVDNTIRFEAIFSDFNDNIVTPTLINFKVYNSKYMILNTYSVNLVDNKIAIGNYFFDYTPDKIGVFYYEWYAEILGNVAITRVLFNVVFYK